MHEATARQPKRVLVLEDDVDFAKIIKALLEHTERDAPVDGRRDDDTTPLSHETRCVYGQWVVTVAGTLATASELLHNNTFDVALLDLILPDGQREDVVNIVRESAPDVPIVIHSGLADSDMVRKLLLNGAVADYIVKGDITRSRALKQRLCHAIDRFHLLRDVENMQRSIVDNVTASDPQPHHCCKA